MKGGGIGPGMGVEVARERGKVGEGTMQWVGEVPAIDGTES